jgi:hypothetical protein
VAITGVTGLVGRDDGRRSKEELEMTYVPLREALREAVEEIRGET